MRARSLNSTRADGRVNPGEEQSAEHCKAKETEERFDGDQQIRDTAVGYQCSVANGGNRLNTEEEGVLEALQRPHRRSVERARTGKPVERGKGQVRDDIGGGNQREEPADGHRQQCVVGVVSMERSERASADIERAVVIQEPCPAPVRHPAAETEVLIQPFLIG